MIRSSQARLGAIAVLALLQAVSGRAQNPTDISGTWVVELHGSRAFLQIRTPARDDRLADRSTRGWGGDWNMGQSLDADAFAGLPANDDRLTVEQVRFELHREAGTLAFQGSFRAGRGAGLFTFVPRPQFIAEMKSAGYTDDLPLWRRFQLAVHDVGPKYIGAMKAEGYKTLTLDQAQRAKTHGVSLDYIRAMKAEGYTVGAIEGLVRTRDHGVTAEYVQAMRRAGFKDVPLADLVRAKDHGVSPEFIQELRDQGVAVPTLDAYVRLRDHGVRGALIRDLAAQGYKNLPIEDVVRAKDHGVSAEYVSDMKGLGLKDLTLPQIVRLRDHGITPGFVNHVRAQGYKEDTAEGLIGLKNRGTWRN